MRVPQLSPYVVKSSVQALAETMDYNHRILNTPPMWLVTMGEGIKGTVLDTGLPNHFDIKPAGGKNFTSDPDERDGNGHATHVGGIIHATANNGMGVAGICPKAEIYYGKVLADNGAGQTQWIADGIRWSVDEIGVDFINMSLGLSRASASQPFDDVMQEACAYAYSKGVAIICATGNEAGIVSEPACYDMTIAVAAVNSALEHANFANYGPEVDIAAGGVDVFSCFPDNRYVRFSGTSESSPVIAGACGLILAKHKAEGVTLSPSELLEHLVRMAYDIGPEGVDELTGAGIPVFKKPSEQRGLGPITGVEPTEVLWRLLTDGLAVGAKVLAGDGEGTQGSLEDAMRAVLLHSANNAHVYDQRARKSQ